MTKQQLVFKVADKLGKDPAVVEAVITETMTVTREALASGQSIFIRGFGTWSPKVRAQKVARNITRGTKIVVPAHKVPHFKPSKEFKEAVK